MTRIDFGHMQPDTIEHRLRRLLAEWHVKRVMGTPCPDPLTPADRAEARWLLSCKREAAKEWLRRERARKVHAGPNVLLFGRRR